MVQFTPAPSVLSCPMEKDFKVWVHIVSLVLRAALVVQSWFPREHGHSLVTSGEHLSLHSSYRLLGTLVILWEMTSCLRPQRSLGPTADTCSCVDLRKQFERISQIFSRERGLLILRWAGFLEPCTQVQGTPRCPATLSGCACSGCVWRQTHASSTRSAAPPPPLACLVQGSPSAQVGWERRQRPWWRHEQLSVAAALATARHHSSATVLATRREGQQEEVELETHASPGTRLGVLSEVAGRRRQSRVTWLPRLPRSSRLRWRSTTGSTTPPSSSSSNRSCGLARRMRCLSPDLSPNDFLFKVHRLGHLVLSQHLP